MNPSVIVWLACSLTHLARVDDLRQHDGKVYAHVQAWVYGPAPLPEEVPVSTFAPGTPPPPELPQPQLEALRLENGTWRRLAALPLSETSRMLDLVTKRNVSGSVVQVRIDGAEGAKVTVIVESEGRPVRRTSTTAGLAEFLGLAPGKYTVRAEAPGYRMWEPGSIHLPDRCAETSVLLQRYGLQEWAREQMAPVLSLVKATWMVATEYLR